MLTSCLGLRIRFCLKEFIADAARVSFLADTALASVRGEGAARLRYEADLVTETPEAIAVGSSVASWFNGGAFTESA